MPPTEPAKPLTPEGVTTTLAPAQVTAPTPSELEADRRLTDLRRRVNLIAENDAKIVEGVNRFKDVPTAWEEEDRVAYLAALKAPDDGPAKALGFKNKRALRLAIYGTMPKKDVPFAIQAAHERIGMRIRKDGNRGTGNTFNLNMVTIPAPRPPGPEDRVVIVQAEKKG